MYNPADFFWAVKRTRLRNKNKTIPFCVQRWRRRVVEKKKIKFSKSIRTRRRKPNDSISCLQPIAVFNTIRSDCTSFLPYSSVPIITLVWELNRSAFSSLWTSHEWKLCRLCIFISFFPLSMKLYFIMDKTHIYI